MRPYVIVNVAVSADGKLSTRERRQVKISGTEDFERVDELKAGCDAIMVGIGTVLADDPSLTVKSSKLISERVRNGKPEHPVRIVVDSHARTPVEAKILHKGSGVRVIATSHAAPAEEITRLKQYAQVMQCGDERVDLTVLMEKLVEMGINRLMVEGGGTLIFSMLAAGLVDELIMFVGNMIIGGKDAPTLADGSGFISEADFLSLERVSVIPMDEGILLHWKVRNKNAKRIK